MANEAEREGFRLWGSSRSLWCFSTCHSRWATPGAQKCPLLPLRHTGCLSGTFIFLVCLLFVWMWSGTAGWDPNASSSHHLWPPRCSQRAPLILCAQTIRPRGLMPQQSSELCRAQFVTQSCRKRCGIGRIGMLGCAEEKQMRKNKRQMHYWFPALHLRSLAKNSQRM